MRRRYPNLSKMRFNLSSILNIDIITSKYIRVEDRMSR